MSRRNSREAKARRRGKRGHETVRKDLSSGVNKLTPEDGGEAPGDDMTLEFDPEAFDRIRAIRGLDVDVLEAMEAGGPAAVVALVAPYGVRPRTEGEKMVLGI